MKMLFTLTLTLSLAASLATSAWAAPKHGLEVELRDGAGKKIGTAKITELKTGVNVHLDVAGLSPGEHAVHFHEKGTCTGPDFKSAGGHYNPSHHEHGLDNPKGPHEGDMRNFTVGADGKASVDVKDERVNLGSGADSLRQSGGTALVIHAKGDDYKSQPAGAAGDRVACGEIH
jgi:Cu-Zn family superoxide dismutase